MQILDRASADADKSTPQRRENGACQNIDWAVTECAAVAAHFHPQCYDLMMAGGVEQTGQHGQYESYEIHRTPLE
jgi:hypothetical protein